MSRAAAAVQEPTMEEILASIRRIVSDDEPDTVIAEEDNVLDLTPDMMEGGPEADAPTAERAMDEVSADPMSLQDVDVMAEFDEPEAQPAAKAMPPAQAPAPGPQATSSDLMSGAASGAVASAFGNLNHLVMSQNARTLDDIVTEMMRPMLREWLDDNLPPLVEKLVKDEIQRISRAQ